MDDFALAQVALAKHLRAIAEAVKAWDNRDLAKAKARGDSGLSRTLFEHDLASIAAMLEGSHHLYQLEMKGKRGKSSGPAIDRKIDRKIEIVRYIDEVRRGHARGGVGKGQRAAMAKFNISEGQAKAIWNNLRHALTPGNEEMVPFLAKLAAKGLVQVSRAKRTSK